MWYYIKVNKPGQEGFMRMGKIALCVLALFLLLGCSPSEDPRGRQMGDYERQVTEARNLTDSAEKFYHEAMRLDIGSQRDSKMQEAYRRASRAMEILNRLDDKYGGSEVPEGHVPIHVPVLRKCSRVNSDIVKMIGIGK
jgi:hypothetical protein